MKVPFNSLIPQVQAHRSELVAAMLRVLDSGWYVLGEEVIAFEREFAALMGSRCCVSVASGLDALILALKALGISEGDEVLVPSNTYIATVMAITANNAVPVFVEPDDYYGMAPHLLESAITSKTKAILPVHLYGQACDMNAITDIANKYNLLIVEDCAQSHGAIFKGQKTGTFGKIGCFSFYPTKNLGAFGDGGAIITDDESVADRISLLRNYGSSRKYHHELEGVNSRLDEIQAALLRVKLPYLSGLIAERQSIAKRYLSHIKNPLLELPKIRKGATHTWHLFVIKTSERNRLQKYLKSQGIGTQIHYPIPPHLSPAYASWGKKKGEFPVAENLADTVLSLPLFNGMEETDQERVITACNCFA